METLHHHRLSTTTLNKTLSTTTVHNQPPAPPTNPCTPAPSVRVVCPAGLDQRGQGRERVCRDVLPLLQDHHLVKDLPRVHTRKWVLPSQQLPGDHPQGVDVAGLGQTSLVQHLWRLWDELSIGLISLFWTRFILLISVFWTRFIW